MKRHNISVYVPFTKSDNEQRMVYGYCTSESLDSQGEIILREAIINAWEKYMEYGNIREMHQPSAVGVTKEYTHDENGTYIGVKVVDDRAWKFVKEGVYKGFSIGGRVLKKKDNIIQELILSEISLVDRPANPDAKFAVSKVDDGLVDQLQLEANQNNTMLKFVTIDGVKYKEDPNKPGEALVDETSGEKVALTEEEIASLETSTEEEKGDDNTNEETTTEETVEETAGDGSSDEVAETTEETPVETPADEAGEKADKTTDLNKSWTAKATEAGILSKDSSGVIMLAEVLSHLEWVAECLGEKMEGTLSPVKTALMSAIASQTAETKEDADKGGDLNKMMGDQLSKAVAPLMEKMDGIVESVANIKKDVDAIKAMRVAPRPKGNAQVIDKTIQNEVSKSNKTLVEKQNAVAAIEKEIDEFAKTEGERVKADPTLTASFMEKSRQLHTKLTNAKNELKGIEA